MTTKEKVARRKRSLLELATELGNVSKACRVMGYSRQQFYEIRRNFQTFGAEGLLDRMAGARAPHPPSKNVGPFPAAVVRYEATWVRRAIAAPSAAPRNGPSGIRQQRLLAKSWTNEQTEAGRMTLTD